MWRDIHASWRIYFSYYYKYNLNFLCISADPMYVSKQMWFGNLTCSGGAVLLPLCLWYYCCEPSFCVCTIFSKKGHDEMMMIVFFFASYAIGIPTCTLLYAEVGVDSHHHDRHRELTEAKSLHRLWYRALVEALQL